MGRARLAKSEGFTLIELMIVVAIIGILAAIAVPRFANLIRKSGEGSSKGNLGALRSAMSIYYGDMEGQYPSDFYALTVSSKYLSTIPSARTPNYHDDSSAVYYGAFFTATDAGGWQMNNIIGLANYGYVWVNCNHTDTKGNIWTSY